MKIHTTTGIILRRLDYGEADKIITLLTPDLGQVSAIAKGIRRPKSKLAGGLELFSESNISLIQTKGELQLIRSARLIQHYRGIIVEYDRVEFGYLGIELVYKASKEMSEAELYILLLQLFKELDDAKTPLKIIQIWFWLQFLAILGQQPNLTHAADGRPLDKDGLYILDPDLGGLVLRPNGAIDSATIKSWRLLTALRPSKARTVGGLQDAIANSHATMQRFVESIITL